MPGPGPAPLGRGGLLKNFQPAARRVSATPPRQQAPVSHAPAPRHQAVPSPRPRVVKAPAPKRPAPQKIPAWLQSLGNISTPLSGTALVNASHSITDADFAPLLADLDTQKTGVNKSATTQHGWTQSNYDALNALLGNIGGAQAHANTASSAAAAQRAAATQGAIGSAGQQAQQGLAQDAAVRGADVQGAGVADQATRTAAAQQQAAQEAQRNQAATQQFGEVTAAFMRGLQGATAQQGGEAQTAITGAQNSRLAKIGQSRNDLLSKKAGAFTDTLVKMRQNEAQNAITEAGLLNDQQRALLSAATTRRGQDIGKANAAASRASANANARAGRAVTKRGQDITQSNAQLAHQDRQAALAARKNGGHLGANTKDVGKAQDNYGGAFTDAQTLWDQGVRDRHKLASILLNGQKPQSVATVNTKTKNGSISQKVTKGQTIGKHDALWTSVALDILTDGHVSSYNAQRLHAQGIAVSDLGLDSASNHRGRVTQRRTNSERQTGPH